MLLEQESTHARLSASINVMFTRARFVDRIAAAAHAGFAGIEIQHLGDTPPRDIAHAARQAGVAVALLNVGLGDLLEGGPGLSGVPGRQEAFRRALDQAIEAGLVLAASTLHLGPSRVPAGVDRADCLAVYRENVGFACERVFGTGIVPAIEPMNRIDAPDGLLGELELAATIVAAQPGLGLLFDAYHVAKSGSDPARAFVRHRDTVKHIQIADTPKRTPPGTGRIAWQDFFGEVRASGYNGWVGAEYPTTGNDPHDFAWVEPTRADLMQKNAKAK